MSRTRRGLLLVGLSLLLGGLAASDVARREAALARRLGPLVEVVVARDDLAAGTELAPGHLAVRRIPARYAVPGAAAAPGEVLGARLAVPTPRGGAVGPATTELEVAGPGALIRRGERAVPVIATGSAELVVPGSRVDVLVTREGATELALQDVEVLSAEAAPEPPAGGGPRVAATLRVSLRQAVFLAAAESFAREVRLLPRAPGDRGRAQRLAVGEGLR